MVFDVKSEKDISSIIVLPQIGSIIKSFEDIAVLSPNISITKSIISHGNTIVNPLRAKMFRANKHIYYLHFISFLHIDMTQVVGILSHVRLELNYST